MLRTDVYCGLEIKNSGSSSSIDFRYFEQRKTASVVWDIWLSRMQVGEDMQWRTSGRLAAFFNSSVEARQATLGT